MTHVRCSRRVTRDGAGQTEGDDHPVENRRRRRIARYLLAALRVSAACEHPVPRPASSSTQPTGSPLACGCRLVAGGLAAHRFANTELARAGSPLGSWSASSGSPTAALAWATCTCAITLPVFAELSPRSPSGRYCRRMGMGVGFVVVAVWPLVGHSRRLPGIVLAPRRRRGPSPAAAGVFDEAVRCLAVSPLRGGELRSGGRPRSRIAHALRYFGMQMSWPRRLASD